MFALMQLCIILLPVVQFELEFVEFKFKLNLFESFAKEKKKETPFQHSNRLSPSPRAAHVGPASAPPSPYTAHPVRTCLQHDRAFLSPTGGAHLSGPPSTSRARLRRCPWPCTELHRCPWTPVQARPARREPSVSAPHPHQTGFAPFLRSRRTQVEIESRHCAPPRAALGSHANAPAPYK